MYFNFIDVVGYATTNEC